MITASILFGAVLLLVMVARGTGLGVLTSVERRFLLAAPLPVILALLLPSSLALWRAGTDRGRESAALLSQIGIWLSGALVLFGVWLLRARRLRGEPGDFRLTLGVLLAGIPLFMVLTVGLFYLMRG
jgi:hypothetical protein